jgi:diacylglycerol kinase
MSSDWPGGPDDPGPGRACRRGWGEKFAEAARGVKLGVRGQASFAVHFFFATLAVLAAVLLECDRVDWCLIVLCIGLVLTAELLNSSLETLFHGLDADTKGRLVGVLDIAAGAVLVASGSAAVVGGVVFVRRLLVFTGAA